MMSRRFRASRHLLKVTPAAAIIAMSGCGGVSPEQQAITDAAAAMHGMGFPGGTPLPATAKRAEQLQRVVAGLKIAAESKNPGEAAAAQSLIARAQGGLAEIAAADAAAAEKRALEEISNIRAAFDQWVGQRAIAASLESHDATAELAELDRKIREREAEAARAAEAKQAQVALVAQIRAKAAQAREQAREFRQRESEIRAGAATMNQTQRAAVLEQAIAIRRQGDAYEKEAAGFEAEAASHAPEIDTLQAGIDKLNRQVELLREARRATVARAEASRAQAAAARAAADGAAARVGQMLGALKSAREATIEPTEKAAKLYGAAISAAKKSGGTTPSSKSAANMAAGNIQQSLGDLLADKARGLGVYARLIDTLARGGQPGITMQEAADAAKAHADAVGAAEDMYRSAIASFESAAGGGGDIRERIERVTGAMKRLLRAEESAASAPDAGAAPPPVPPAGGTAVEKPASGAPDGFDAAAVTAEVRQALEQMHADVGDVSRAADVAATWLHATDPEVKAFVDTAGNLTRQKIALDAACRAKYGKELAGLIAESRSASVKANPLFAMLGTMGGQLTQQLEALNPETAEITPTAADAATIRVPATPEPFTLVKVDGSWKLSLDSMFAGGAGKQMMAMAAAPMAALGKAFGEVSAKIESGGFADAEAMLLELNRLVLSSMPQGGMGRPRGGGG